MLEVGTRQILHWNVTAHPTADWFYERLIGTIRRECFYFMIPPSERHLRGMLGEWIRHYNRGRPHNRLGSGLPDPPPGRVVVLNGHHLRDCDRVVTTPILGGLHHEYSLEAAG